jgi:hypothetical protein
VKLVEAAAAAAIVAVIVGGVFSALSGFGKYITQQGGPARRAALIEAQQTMRLAQNAWKYGSPGNAPSGSQTIALPLSSQTTAPATITTTVAPNGNSAQIQVTVRYTPEPGRRDPGVVELNSQVDVKAPLPGSQVNRPGLIPQPSGAP